MAFLNFFKTPKNQRYEYKPRYWDPDKEKMKERLKYLESIKGDSAEAVKKRLSGGFRKAKGDPKLRAKAVRRSNLLLLGIIVVLILVSYVFLTVYLQEIIEVLE